MGEQGLGSSMLRASFPLARDQCLSREQADPDLHYESHLSGSGPEAEIKAGRVARSREEIKY